jgi:flagellar hook-associated protein 2
MAVTSSSAVLDVPALVSQLMAVERQPINTLNTKVSSYQTKISSLGTLSGLVSSFQAALQALKTNLEGYSATPSDASVLSATATSTAAAGIYSLTVAHLAQAQNLVASGQTSATAAISTVASTVTLDVGGTSTDVAIAAGATLQDIRATINSANLGVTATIVNDGSGRPYRLALTSNNAGVSNAIDSITIKTGGDANLNSLLAYNPTENAPGAPVPPDTALTQVVAPLDASFTVNGIAITSASNTVTDAIQGVTLTLKTPTTTPVNLTVTRDTSAISTAVSGFIDAYNALTSQLRSRSAYGSAATTAPVLAGDGTVRLMLDQLRGIFMTPATGGTLSYLSQIGITTQADGSLKLDSSKLNSAMANDFSDVANLFSSATGFATRLDAWATSVVQTGGLIDARTKSLDTSIKGYNDQISKLEIRMTILQKQYTNTYTNLNMLLSNMNSLSSYLTSQFSPKTTS